MPIKRSRVGSSSAYLETTVATAASHSPAKLVKIDVASVAPPPKSLTISSLVNVGECIQTKIGGFLERCHYCNKQIARDSDIFMYSNLCAFCSIECRDCQINLDQSARKNLED